MRIERDKKVEVLFFSVGLAVFKKFPRVLLQ